MTGRSAGKALRIIAGRFKNRALDAPPGIRPTASRVREALFSRWQGSIEGARVLDLFSGSGAMCLEAISRGAASAVGVDESAQSIRAADGNAIRLGANLPVRFLRARLPEVLKDEPALAGEFDLIFVDPPYTWDRYDEVLEHTTKMLTPHGELVVEHSTRRELPLRGSGWCRVATREYGETTLSAYVLELPESPTG